MFYLINGCIMNVMSGNSIALWFEIIGFIMATILGSILLSPDIIGTRVHRVTDEFNRISNRIIGWYWPLTKFGTLMLNEPDNILGATILRGSVAVCIITGWFINDSF